MKRPNKLSLDRQKEAAVVYRAFTLNNFPRVRKNSNEFRFDLKSLKKDFFVQRSDVHISSLRDAQTHTVCLFYYFVAMRL